MSDLRLTALTVAVAAARHGRLVNILAGGVASSAVYTTPLLGRGSFSVSGWRVGC